MLRGFCLQGGFSLRQEFSWLRRQVEDSKLFTSTYGPRDVVSFVKLGHISVKNGIIEENVAFDPKQILLAKAKRILDIGGVQLQPTSQGFLVKDPETDNASFTASQTHVLGQSQPQTPQASLVSMCHAHTVKLFPRPSCSCSYMGLCGHIIAAKISIGIDMDSEMEKLNDEFVSRSLKSEEAGPNKKRRKRKKKVKLEDEQMEMSIHTNGESVDMEIDGTEDTTEQTTVHLLESMTTNVVPDGIFQ